MLLSEEFSVGFFLACLPLLPPKRFFKMNLKHTSETTSHSSVNELQKHCGDQHLIMTGNMPSVYQNSKSLFYTYGIFTAYMFLKLIFPWKLF